MLVGIEYFLEGRAVTVYFGSDAPQLPVRLRDGSIAFHRWGTRGRIFDDDNTPGWLQKFPERGHASLESIQVDQWSRYEPQPVRIPASRFIQIDSWAIPHYFPLERGEYIQGLLATISYHKRLYVVTVPAPTEYASEWSSWPRIVAGHAGGTR